LAHIGPLPVAALRIGAEAVAALNGLGLRRIADVAVLPRAPLARRIGPEVAERLDQALGLAPEPVSPARADQVLSLRLTLPEPIGREADVLAGIDRLLPPLCERLRAAGQGVLRLRLTLVRTDGRAERREVGLARATDRAEAIRPLLALKLGEIDAGFGIEAIRLTAVAVEAVGPRQGRGVLAGEELAGEEPEVLGDLLGRLGARLGLEALTRLHPAESHIPEKGDTVMAAGFSRPAADWPTPAAPRPVVLFPPEPIAPQDDGVPPRAFVWRRRLRRRAAAFGPERIAPEWWLDDPGWRSGPRDYWRVETEEGERLWIYEARGGEIAAGWFAQGVFA
jgi:protein ImuB